MIGTLPMVRHQVPAPVFFIEPIRELQLHTVVVEQGDSAEPWSSGGFSSQRFASVPVAPSPPLMLPVTYVD